MCAIPDPRKQTVRGKLVHFENRGYYFELLDGEQTNLPHMSGYGFRLHRVPRTFNV